jgi:3-deoxy-7-phosphoheptulonate synthase
MENSNIEEFKSLISPSSIKEQIPVKRETKVMIQQWRTEITKIVSGESDKKLFIVGPCSIHNTVEALVYAKKLKEIADIVSDTMLIVMRVYFEKPRTTIGWKGLINDPGLDNSFRVNDGMLEARRLLLDINNLGLPCGYEILDTITPQYICDLISWGAIGARTTESQVHRQMVSGLSMPVGFKNGTGGSKKIARDGILSAKFKHCFMGITDNSIAAICKTLGNNDCHIILRGGNGCPNYSIKDIEETRTLLEECDINQTIMIDCSHDNSLKNYRNQPSVFHKILEYMKNDKNIIGGMIESNINEGNQVLTNKNALDYGVSITDGCINIETTQQLLVQGDIILKSYKYNIV